MSRTDKDRPYIVKCYDSYYERSSNHHVVAWHRCGRPARVRRKGWVTHTCDLGVAPTKEIKSAVDSNSWKLGRLGAVCEKVLYEDLNSSGQRWFKRDLRHIRRRKARQWCRDARRNPEQADLRMPGYYEHVRWAHKDF